MSASCLVRNSICLSSVKATVMDNEIVKTNQSTHCLKKPKLYLGHITVGSVCFYLKIISTLQQNLL